MKKQASWLICCLLLAECANPKKDRVAQAMDSLNCPLLKYGKERVAYQFGKMTADKGLKLFLDTATFTIGESYLLDSLGLYLDNSAAHALLPFRITCSDMETVNGIVMVKETDRPNAVIGLIHQDGSLRAKYDNQQFLLEPVNSVVMDKGEWSNVFKKDSVQVQISAVLERETAGRHLTGPGELVFTENGERIEQRVYLICEAPGRD